MTLLPRYYGRRNIFFFLFLLISLYTFVKKKRILFLRFLDRYGSHVVETKKNARNEKMFSPYMTNEKYFFFFFYGSHVDIQYAFATQSCIDSRPIDVHRETHKCLCNFTQRCHNPILYILLSLDTRFERVQNVPQRTIYVE